MSQPHERRLASVTAVRELMSKRLEASSLDADAKREMQMALEELDVMWEELQRYAEFFEYTPDAYVITDAAGSVREVNQAALELFAAARDDLIGRPLSEYIASVRAIPLMKSGGGLCWLLRPAT